MRRSIALVASPTISSRCAGSFAAALATQWWMCCSRRPTATLCSALVDRADLRQHVDAVGVLLDHPLQPADLTLDATEPLDVGVLVRAVAVRAR